MRPAFKNGKAARERMGVAPERYARAESNVVPRGPVSNEPDPLNRCAIDEVNH